MNFFSKLLAKAGLLTNYADFDTASTQVGAVGRMVWNDTDGTVDLGLKGGSVTLQIGQEQVARVVNKSGVTLSEANYQVVRISDAQGQRIAVDLAKADSDANSADTLGIVTETILNNQEGFITVLGEVRGINTTGSLQSETWADGDILYLSATTAGAITNVKPVAPAHLVVVGYVEYSHSTQGKIFVKIQNGYELNELHDVLITTPSNNQVLGYDSATSLWKNASIATWLGYTPYNAASISGASGTVPLFGASNTLGNSVITQSGGNITISGSLTVDTNTLFVDSVNNRVGIGSFAGGTGVLPTNNKLWLQGAGGSGTSIQNRIDIGFNDNPTYSAYIGVENPDFSNTVLVLGSQQGGTSTSALWIRNGNVQIGSRTPTAGAEKIQVTGTASFSSTVLISGNTAIDAILKVRNSASDTWASSANDGLALQGTGASNGISTISTYLDNSSIRIGAGVTQKTGLFINGQTATGGSYVAISASGAERLRINSVGISVTGAIVATSSVTASFLSLDDGSDSAIIKWGSTDIFKYNDISSLYTLPALATASGTQYVTVDASGNLGYATPSGGGTVTSVAMTVPTGLSISGSPITTSGTFALTYSVGYSIPTNAKQSEWDTAYSNRITTLTTTGTSGAATLVGNTLNIPIYTGGGGSYINDNGTTPVSQNGSSFWTTEVNAIVNSSSYSPLAPATKLVINAWYESSSIGTVSDFVGTPINTDFQIGAFYNLGTPFSAEEATSIFIGMTNGLTSGTQKKHAVYILEPETASGEPGSPIMIKNYDATVTLFSVLNGNVFASGQGSFDTVNIGSSITLTNVSGVLGVNSPFSITGALRITSSSAYIGIESYTGTVPTPSAGVVNFYTDGSELFYKNSSGVSEGVVCLNTVQTLTNKTMTGLHLSAGTASDAPISFTASGAVLETTSEVGDFEVDSAGLLYYSTANSSRGIIPAEQFQILTSNYTTATGTASTLKQTFNASTNGAITVAANTTYEFECLIKLASLSGTSGSFGFGFLGTAAFSSVSYIAIANKTALSVQTASSHTLGTAATYTIISAANTTTTGYAWIKGTLVVTTGGTIIPATGASIAAAYIVQAGSYFKISKLGSNTVTTVGNWS